MEQAPAASAIDLVAFVTDLEQLIGLHMVTSTLEPYSISGILRHKADAIERATLLDWATQAAETQPTAPRDTKEQNDGPDRDPV
jgi:hypothetical protein